MVLLFCFRALPFVISIHARPIRCRTFVSSIDTIPNQSCPLYIKAHPFDFVLASLIRASLANHRSKSVVVRAHCSSSHFFFLNRSRSTNTCESHHALRLSSRFQTRTGAPFQQRCSSQDRSTHLTHGHGIHDPHALGMDCRDVDMHIYGLDVPRSIHFTAFQGPQRGSILLRGRSSYQKKRFEEVFVSSIQRPSPIQRAPKINQALAPHWLGLFEAHFGRSIGNSCVHTVHVGSKSRSSRVPRPGLIDRDGLTRCRVVARNDIFYLVREEGSCRRRGTHVSKAQAIHSLAHRQMQALTGGQTPCERLALDRIDRSTTDGSIDRSGPSAAKRSKATRLTDRVILIDGRIEYHPATKQQLRKSLSFIPHTTRPQVTSQTRRTTATTATSGRVSLLEGGGGGGWHFAWRRDESSQ